MCCDGTLFAQVDIATDTALPGAVRVELTREQSQDQHVEQPCVAHRDHGCSVYVDRPTRCRTFRCLLLRRVEADEIPLSAALDIIADARQREHEANHVVIEHFSGSSDRLFVNYRRAEAAIGDEFASPDFRRKHLAAFAAYASFWKWMANHIHQYDTD